MSETDPGDEEFVEEETEAAAEEAGAIGGRRPEGADNPDQPVEEAGGGVAEGFEQAEEALIDHAEHRDAGGNPKYDRPPPEENGDVGVYGEADEAESSEVPEDDR